MTKGCPKCGRIIDSSLEVCPFCNYKFEEIEKVYKMAREREIIKINKYAGLIKRLIAFNIDLVLMAIINFGLLYLFTNFENITNNDLILPAILTFIIYFFYTTILEGSSLQGTIGDAVIGIKVTDDAGYQTGFSISFKRNILKILNILTLGIGYIALLFSKHRQTLGDFASSTYVENKVTEYNTNLIYGNIILRVFAFVIDLIIINIIGIGIYFLTNYLFEIYNFGIDKKLFITIFLSMLTVVYFIFLDSSSATFGKRLFNLKVTNMDGKKINPFKALFRIILLFVEVLVPFGIFLCLTTPLHQTLKDYLSKTVVIKSLE